MDESFTNLDHIRSSLKSYDESKSTKECIVLVGTGSYNPVHRGHVEIFQSVRTTMEQKYNFHVLAGFMSPSHCAYVCEKLGHDFIQDTHRINMLNLALKESGHDCWISVDLWEIKQDRFHDYPAVIKRMKKHLVEFFPDRKIRVIYCAGADHVVRCGCRPLLTPEYGVASISRPGYKQAQGDQIFQIEASFDFDISSTAIRKDIKNKSDLSHLEYKSVLDYMKMNKL